jgi:hypothetical protein
MALCSRRHIASHARLVPMSIDMQAVLLRYPPRELSPLERELIDEWLALAADISGAYVSGRRTDDPALFRRIVIADDSDGQPTHLIHCPERLRLWIKLTLGPYQRVEMFDTLQAALNSIRPVLLE